MSDPAPLVTIVIACLDAETTLGETLQSCLAQTWPALEIVVVDNGSSDGTVALAESFAPRAPWPLRVIHCPERGANRARLVGFREACGAFVNWLDADDTLTPAKIERQVHALLANPGRDIAYGDWIWRVHAEASVGTIELARMAAAHSALAYGDRRWRLCVDSPCIAETHVRLAPYDDFLLRLLEDKWLPPHAYLLRRSALDRLLAAGALPPDRRVAQDREFFTTAALLGMRFLYVPDSVAVYQSRSASQITRRTPPDARARALAAIHARLRSIAARGGAARLRDRHRLMLAQPWDQMMVTPGVGRPEREASGRFRVSWRDGTAARIDRDTARVLDVLLDIRPSGTVEQLAKQVQHREPALWERHADVVKSLLQLRDRGVLRTLTMDAPAPSGAAGVREPRVLLVTDIAFWQRGRGDAARILALVRYLNRHATLAVFVLAPRTTPAPALSGTTIEVEGERVRAWLANAPDLQIARAMLARALAREAAQVCLFEYLRLADLRPAVPLGVLALLDTHDLVSARAESFRAHGAVPPVDLGTEAEFAAFAQFDAVILIQEDEFEVVAAGLGKERCILAPHPVEMPRVPVRPAATRVTFVGSEYAPNVDGLRWFLEKVWKWRDTGGAQLHIYGRVNQRVPVKGMRNVVEHGFVDDLGAVYRDTDIAINPVRFGAGLKIKTVEALASGLPLVTTAEGARGLGQFAGEAFLVADEPAEFGSHLGALLASVEQRSALADAAWRVAREHFTPKACFDPLLQRILETTARK